MSHSALNEEQFREVMLPDVGRMGRSYRWREPSVPEGHTRLYRFSSGGPHGHYADKPLTAYGSDMYYADVPHEQLEGFRRGEGGTFTLGPGEARIRQANWQKEVSSSKPYELTDYQEYGQRWPR